MNTTPHAVLVSLIDVAVSSDDYTHPDLVEIETSEFEIGTSFTAEDYKAADADLLEMSSNIVMSEDGVESNNTIDRLGLSLEINNLPFEALTPEEQIDRLAAQIAQDDECVALVAKDALEHAEDPTQAVDQVLFNTGTTRLDPTTEAVATPAPAVSFAKVLEPIFIEEPKPVVEKVNKKLSRENLNGVKPPSVPNKVNPPTKTKKSKTMNKTQSANQFSAVPNTPVVAKTNTLQDLVKNGIGSQAVKAKSGLTHSTKAMALLSKAMGSFKNTVVKPPVDKVNGIDGVDYINTASAGDTPLGRALDINYHIRFQYQNTGWFASVGAVWFFILSDIRDESLRNLYGVSCRNIRDRINARHVEGFRTIIADATWAKINSNKHFAAAIVKNELPYACFYTKYISEANGKQTKQVVDTSIAYWYVAVIEEISRTLKESAKTGDNTLVPDFGFVENLYDNTYRKQA